MTDYRAFSTIGVLQRSDDSEWRQDCLALLLQLLCRIGTLATSEAGQTPKLHPVSSFIFLSNFFLIIISFETIKAFSFTHHFICRQGCSVTVM